MVMSEISFMSPKYFSKFVENFEYLQVCGAVPIDIMINCIQNSKDMV